MNFPIPDTGRKLIVFLATGFGSGRISKAPGTIGSLVAILPYLFLQQLDLWLYSLLLTLFSLAGIYICSVADRVMVSKDNPSIVWDEFCGLWLTLWATPPGWQSILLGFVLFRLFDILKPWPVSWAEKSFSGGLGVMLDDLVAGILACSCLHLSLYLLDIY